MDRSYTEQIEGDKPLNWYKVLTGKSLTERDWFEMKLLAGSWVTCAVGSQCSVIPRDEMGEPEDRELCWLGLEFMNNIQVRDRKKAIETLDKIEKRSAELISFHTQNL